MSHFKVLFYFGGFAPTGGIETFCKNLLVHLNANEYPCELVCWGKSSQLIKVIQEHKIKINRSFWRWGCKWNLPDWFLLLIGFWSLKNSDVVFFGKLFPLPILNILRSQAKSHTKFIYVTPYKPEVSSFIEAKKLSKSLNLFNLILVQSQCFIQALKESNYLGDIAVIPYITAFKSQLLDLPPKTTLHIGFLGRLVPDKNISLLLQAFKFLKKLNCNLNAKLNLFGDGSLRNQLESLANDLGIKDSVIFHGEVPHNQVSDVISSCHLFVFTSINEGQCLAALEILSCGRPIVATNAGALPEILSDSRLGKLVEFTPESVATGILEVAQLLEESITPEDIRSAYLERFDPQKVGDRYIEIINSLE